MKKTSTTIDKSAPYRTVGIGKIDAPVKDKDQPKSAVIKSNKDLRGGKA